MSRCSLTEETNEAIKNWSRLLEIITWRHRFIQNAYASDILMKIYEESTADMGIDMCHGFMRPLNFDFAKKKNDDEKKPLTMRQLIDDESRLDRYVHLLWNRNKALAISGIFLDLF